MKLPDTFEDANNLVYRAYFDVSSGKASPELFSFVVRAYADWAYKVKEKFDEVFPQLTEVVNADVQVMHEEAAKLRQILEE